MSKIKIIHQLLDRQKTNGDILRKEINAKFVAYNGEYNFFMLPIYLEKRDEFIKYCSENGVEVGKHFSKSIKWAKEFGYVDGNCPNAERIAETIVTLPCHYSYKNRKLKNVIAVQTRVENEDSIRELGQFDVITSRAFASLLDFVDASKPYMHEKTIIAAMKGLVPQDEIEQLQAEFSCKVIELAVPRLDEQRHLLLLERI